MKKQVLILLLSLSMGLFNTLQAQNGTPTAPTTEEEYIQDQWTVYAYNRNYVFFGLIEVNPTYRGYYIDVNSYGANNLNINSQFTWDGNASPSSAAGYTGDSVTNDEHIVDYRRKGFPAGWYQLKVWHDDEGEITLNDNSIYSDSNVISDYTLPSLVYLDEDSELSFRWKEDGGESYGRLEFTKTASDFGDGEWQVSVFGDTNFTNSAGMYIQSGLDFSTPWANNDTPSDAPGYTGVTVGNSNSYFYKRKNFPCGFYSIDVREHDDDAELVIDGTSVWSAIGWTAT